MTATKKHIILFLLLFAFLLIPNSFGYALPDLFHPKNSDSDLIITTVLNPIFGYNIVEQSENQNLFGIIAQKFSYGVICLAFIIGTYVIFTSTVNTAQDGQVLGRNWASPWTVIRSTAGFLLLFPVNSLSAIQFIVVYLFAQGILFGNVMWETYIQVPVMSNINVGDAFKQSVSNSIARATKAQLCLDVLGKHSGNNYVMTKTNQSGNGTWGGLFDSKAEDKIEKGLFSTDVMSKDVSVQYYNYLTDNENLTCGKFKYTKLNNVITEGDNSAKSSLEDYAGSDLVQLESYHNGVKLIHENLVENIFNNYAKTLSAGIIKKYAEIEQNGGQGGEELVKALASYMKQISNNYAEQIEKLGNSHDFYNKEVIEQMQKYGFASAGAWFYKVNDMVDKVTTIANLSVDLEVVDLLKASLNKDDNKQASYIYNKSADANKELAIYHAIVDEAFLKSDEINNVYSSASAEDDTVQMFVKFFSKYNSDALDGMRYSDSEVNIITQSHAVGNSMINGAVATIAGYATLKAIGENGGKLIDKIPLLGTFLNSSIDAFITIFNLLGIPILMMIIVPGMLLSYYVPFIPFIYWVSMVIGLLINLAQTVFGVQLLMLAHLFPDRDSFVGRQGQGYMQILNLVLKPGLMIIGILTASVFLQPVGKIINKFYFFTAYSIQEQSYGIAYIISFAASAIMYFIISHSIVKKLFSVIYSLSDELLTWLGGSANSIMQQFARDVESGTTASASQSFAMGALMQSGIQGLKSNKNPSGIGGIGGAKDKDNQADLAKLENQQNKADALESAKGSLEKDREELKGLSSSLAKLHKQKYEGKDENGNPIKVDDNEIAGLQSKIGEVQDRVQAGESAVNQATIENKVASILANAKTDRDAMNMAKKGGAFRIKNGRIERIEPNQPIILSEMEKQIGQINQLKNKSE